MTVETVGGLNRSLVLDERTTFASRTRAFKSEGCSFVLSALLLTKKLTTFLSRLNEISGGCEKILPVSGSFEVIFKTIKSDGFDCVIIGMKVKE